MKDSSCCKVWSLKWEITHSNFQGLEFFFPFLYSHTSVPMIFDRWKIKLHEVWIWLCSMAELDGLRLELFQFREQKCMIGPSGCSLVIFFSYNFELSLQQFICFEWSIHNYMFWINKNSNSLIQLFMSENSSIHACVTSPIESKRNSKAPTSFWLL